ncbi:hypothetical protein SRB5_66130 [Streptomyces sp. RB5]|uniref:Uncharacterized protein n=1 Tax=Streptomyces smaragdinus TaxID=2585196 RepID=A0A7K0CUQ8_9ACTN|nr:hypothetical protein [Streptomyces smaragdinus]MQY16414.1 hypothetical protein [Streptomyces smaragdinus]
MTARWDPEAQDWVEEADTGSAPPPPPAAPPPTVLPGQRSGSDSGSGEVWPDAPGTQAPASLHDLPTGHSDTPPPLTPGPPPAPDGPAPIADPYDLSPYQPHDPYLPGPPDDGGGGRRSAATALAVALALVIVVAGGAIGYLLTSDDDDGGNEAKPTPSATTPAADTPTEPPPTSDSPVETAPESRIPPDGYQYNVETDFQLVAPEGWERDVQGSVTWFRDPEDPDRELVQVWRATESVGSPLELVDLAENGDDGLAGRPQYEQHARGEVPGAEAAELDYSWVGDNGGVRGLYRAMRMPDGSLWVVVVSGPPESWPYQQEVQANVLDYFCLTGQCSYEAALD